MNVFAYRAAWASIGLRVSAAELLVALAIADHADRAGVAWPGRKRLAEQTGLSEATIKRALGRLRTLGVLETVATGTGRGKLTRYRLRCVAESGSSVTPFTAGKGGHSHTPFRAEKGSSDAEKGVIGRTQNPYMNHKGRAGSRATVTSLDDAKARRLLEVLSRRGAAAFILDDWRSRAVAMRAIELGADPAMLMRHGCDVPSELRHSAPAFAGMGAEKSGDEAGQAFAG